MMVDIEGGKYTVVFNEQTGELSALRYGAPWRDCTGELPHWNLERDLKRIINQIGWIYQDDVVGDIYCSEKCAE